MIKNDQYNAGVDDVFFDNVDDSAFGSVVHPQTTRMNSDFRRVESTLLRKLEEGEVDYAEQIDSTIPIGYTSETPIDMEPIPPNSLRTDSQLVAMAANLGVPIDPYSVLGQASLGIKPAESLAHPYAEFDPEEHPDAVPVLDSPIGAPLSFTHSPDAHYDIQDKLTPDRKGARYFGNSNSKRAK